MTEEREVRYVSKPQLAERYGVTTRTIDRWSEEGRFPRADLVLPSGHPRWLEETVEKYERDSITERKTGIGVTSRG